MIGIKALAWNDEGGFALSPDAETPWMTRHMHATCLGEMRAPGLCGGHQAPDPNCNCGIHGMFCFGYLLEYLSHPNIDFFGHYRDRLFTAMLEASGKTIVDEFGWRAETAGIIGVTFSPDIAASLCKESVPGRAADFYEVPFLDPREMKGELARQDENLLKDPL